MNTENTYKSPAVDVIQFQMDSFVLAGSIEGLTDSDAIGYGDDGGFFSLD